MNIQTWYGSAVPVPNFTSARFAYFAGSCVGIVKTVFQSRTAQDVHVRFVQSESAFADPSRNLIGISDEFLYGRFPGHEKALKSDVTLSAILGLIVHEAAHFAYSDPTLLPYAEYIEKHTTCTYNKRVALPLGNIIEDIFIESEVCKDVPSFEWMLTSMNGVFFTQEGLERASIESMDVKEAPKTGEELSAAMNALIFGKVYPEIESSEFITRLFHLAQTAVTCATKLARWKLALTIYDALMENIEGEDGKGEGEGEDGEEESLEDLIKRVIGITHNHSEEMKESDGENSIRGDNLRILNDLLKELDDSIVTVENTITERDEQLPIVYFERRLEAQVRPISIDKRYVALAETARQRASVNRPYGEDRNRGHNIRKLYRIGTDQRIFAEQVAMRDYKPMQVVILVDYSGSMQAPVEVKGRVRSTRLEQACQAAAGAALGLSEGRCEVAVYGHTADIGLDGNVNIWRFKGFNEPISDLAQRINNLDGEYTSENRDGYAISYITKKFNSANKKRLLIVISDGSPLANGYSGTSANSHTKAAVDAARRKGIDVLSISIAEDARATNNYIYGKSWNVCNNDPNIIESIVRALL